MKSVVLNRMGIKNLFTLTQRISIGIIIIIPLKALSSDPKKSIQTIPPPHFTAFTPLTAQNENLSGEYKPALNESKTPIIANWERQNNRKFPKELWNALYNIQEKLLSNETDRNAKDAVKLLWSELKKKLLSHNLTSLQIVAFLRDKISTEKISPYTKNIAIQFIEELFRTKELFGQYSLFQPELLKTMNALQEQLFLENVNSYIKVTIIKAMGELLEQYDIPETEMLQALNQLKENLFHKNIYIKQAAVPVVGKLLQTSKAPYTEKQNIIFYIVDHLNSEKLRDKLSSLKILNAFLEWNILFNLLSFSERRAIAFKIAGQIASVHGAVQRAAIVTIGALIIHERILFDPNERRAIAFKIAGQIASPNWRVQEAAIVTIGALITHKRILFDLNDKKTIAFMIIDRVVDDSTFWKNKKAAIGVLNAFLNQSVLSQSEILETAHKMIDLIDDIQQPGRTRKAVSKTIKVFLISDFLPDSEKLKIADLLSKKLPDSPAKARVIDVLKFAKEAGLPLSFDVAYNIVKILSKTDGEKRQIAEALVRKYLKDTAPSSSQEGEQKLLIYLELDRQLSEIELNMRQYANNKTECEESVRSP